MEVSNPITKKIAKINNIFYSILNIFIITYSIVITVLDFDFYTKILLFVNTVIYIAIIPLYFFEWISIGKFDKIRKANNNEKIEYVLKAIGFYLLLSSVSYTIAIAISGLLKGFFLLIILSFSIIVIAVSEVYLYIRILSMSSMLFTIDVAYYIAFFIQISIHIAIYFICKRICMILYLIFINKLRFSIFLKLYSKLEQYFFYYPLSTLRKILTFADLDGFFDILTHKKYIHVLSLLSATYNITLLFYVTHVIPDLNLFGVEIRSYYMYISLSMFMFAVGLATLYKLSTTISNQIIKDLDEKINNPDNKLKE
ncbi:MAG: hypothetical protein B6U89_01810 [Desulfurococcales archaeon ex4484_58]|nr:MAG: hypothetical protein B6U89_01810 [Desulfurococcales archaeon ex4484_58]